MDEIDYRLLCDERGAELRFLLLPSGEIQRISKAVAYIHKNLNNLASVARSAEMLHIVPTTVKEFWQRHKTIGDDSLQDAECLVQIDL